MKKTNSPIINLSDAIHRCGNFHEEDRKMNFYIDGLLPTARTIVAHFSESKLKSDLTFKELTHFASAEGEAVHTDVQQYKSSRNNYY